MSTHSSRNTCPLPAADSGSISIGDKSNVQDGCVIRTASAFLSGHSADTTIGRMVTIGHQASLHGCTVGDRALIGMNSTLLEGCSVRPAGGLLGELPGGGVLQAAGGGMEQTPGSSPCSSRTVVQPPRVAAPAGCLLQGAVGSHSFFSSHCLPLCSWPVMQVEDGAMVAAGAVVAPGTVVKSGEIWGGGQGPG